MNELIAFFRQFLGELRFWVIVAPWEQAIRVRCGRYAKVLLGGIYFKIPVLDTVVIQSIRLRVCNTARQTVMSQDGRSITFSGSIGYSIENIEIVYNTLHHAEDTIMQLVRNILAEDISTHISLECTLEDIIQRTATKLDLEKFGLGQVKLYITELTIAKTYRIIGDYGSGLYGSALST